MAAESNKFYKNKNLYIVLAAIVVFFILFLVLMNQVIMPAYTNYDDGVTVPNVTRESLAEAKHILSSAGLRYGVAERESNEAFPADYVIDQQPAAAKIVKPNRKIYLTVNKISHPTVQVPNINGLSLRNAKIQLENNNLKIGTISYESSRFKNTILHQAIKPGKVVERGIEIDLVVSDGLGQEKVTIPNIKGLLLSDAEQKLREQGLRIGKVRFMPSNQPPKTVLNYSPDAEKVTKGQSIQLVVAERAGNKEPRESGAVMDSTNQLNILP